MCSWHSAQGKSSWMIGRFFGRARVATSEPTLWRGGDFPGTKLQSSQPPGQAFWTRPKPKLEFNPGWRTLLAIGISCQDGKIRAECHSTKLLRTDIYQNILLEPKKPHIKHRSGDRDMDSDCTRFCRLGFSSFAPVCVKDAIVGYMSFHITSGQSRHLNIEQSWSASWPKLERRLHHYRSR